MSTSTSEVLLLSGMPGALTLTVEAVARAADGTTTAVPVPRYHVDLQSDGIFEITSATPATDIVLFRSGIYPVQVTAAKCESPFPLVARQDVFAVSVSVPTMIVRFEPPVQVPIRLQTLILAQVSIISSVNNPPLRLSWDWGDGATAAVVLDQPVVNRTFQHAYAAPGFFPFKVEVRDVRGLKATFETWIISSLPTFDVFRIDVGREMRQHDFYIPLQSSHPGTHIVAAAGASGMIAAHVAADTATFVSRFDPAFPFITDARDVYVDDDHDVAYIAGGEAGMYVLDVSDAVSPRSIYPHIIAPPNVGVNIQRVWGCGGRVFFSNDLDGVYAITLTSSQALDDLRADPDLAISPWAFFRAVSNDSNSTMLRLPHPVVADMACPNDRFMVVAAESRVYLYDLDLFLGTGNSPLLLTRKIELDFPDQPAANIVEVDAARVSAPATFTMAVALLSNGSAEYRVKVSGAGAPALQLRRHRITKRSASLGAGGFISERHASVRVHDMETFVFVDGLQSADAMMVFDNTVASGAVTQTAIYEAGDLCTGSPAFGSFTGKKICRVGVGFQQTSVRFDGNEIWYVDASGLSRFDRSTNQIAAFPVPFQSRGLAIGTQEYWLFTDNQVLRFDRVAVENAAQSALQASPAGVHATGIKVVDVQPRTGIDHEMLLIGESELRWFSTSLTAVLAQTTVVFGIVSAGFLPDSGIAGVIDSGANRVHIWKRTGATADKIMTSSTGYQKLFACGNDLFGWRMSGADLRIERFMPGDNSLQFAASVTAGAFASVACNAGYFYVVELSLSASSWLKVIDRETGELVSQQELPISGSLNLISVRALVDGNWLGVQVRSRGTFFFDLSNGGNPVLVAADFFSQMASGSMFGMTDIGGELRYGVLSVGVDGLGIPQMLIKKTGLP